MAADRAIKQAALRKHQLYQEGLRLAPKASSTSEEYL